MENPFVTIQNDLTTIKLLLLDIQNQKPLSLNKTPDDHILNVNEAGEFVGLKTPTVYSLVSQRKIPFSKNGKKLMFLKSELLQWVKDGRRATTVELDLIASRYIKSKSKTNQVA